jgi:hypothetical protein
VDEDRGSRAGAAGELDRLLGREVAALRVVVSGQTEGALDQEEVGIADALLDGRGRTGVTRIGETRAIGCIDDHAPGRHVVAALDHPDT